MKAVALTIEALALLNNERKKEVQNGNLGNFSLQASNVVLDSRKIQLVNM